MPVASSTAQPRLRRHGAYVLGRRIGSGGMAGVFAARQLGAHGVSRLVAVKVMSTALAGDPSSQRAFLREAAIATRIEHPNVVRTYEVAEVDGEVLIAMELIAGASLARLQKGGPVPLPIALRILTDAARGLHAAHGLTDGAGRELGLVHQDVTPHNVVVGYDGITRLLDFGVARVLSTDGSRTETIRGKPSYVAPEQLLMGRVDRRADLFSLGVIAYELLVGTRLFPQATTMQTALLREAIPDLGATHPRLPVAITDVVMTALRTKPEDRFASADEMRRAFVAARVSAAIAEVDESDVAAWARAVAPPEWTVGELERDLGEASDFAAEHERVADLPTMKGGAVADAPLRARGRARPSRRSVIVMGLLLATTIATLAIRAVYLRPAATSRTNEDAREPPSTASVTTATASSGEVTAAPSAGPTPSASAGPTPSASAGPTPSASALSTTTATGAEPSPPAVRPASSRHRRSPTPTASTSTNDRAASAYLTVWSNPWGHVRIDGRDVGDSPVSHLALDSGSHSVSVTTAAGALQERRILLGAGDDKTERFVF